MRILGTSTVPHIHLARYSFLLLAAACGLPLAASAGDDDTISTDRPDFVESSQVVGKGRLQLETSLQWERDRAHAHDADPAAHRPG